MLNRRQLRKTLPAVFTNVLLASVLCVATACEDKSAVEEETTAEPPEPVPAIPDPVEPSEPAEATFAALITTTSVVRKIASDDRYLPQADGEKKKSNWVATLYRGEQVTVVSQDGAWSKIKTSGDEPGFTKSSGLLKAEEIEVATLNEEAKTFRRPDILTMDAGKTVERGTLLYVVKKKGEFSEVNTSGTTTRWVRTEKLVRDEKEIAAAKLLTQVRYQEGRKEVAKAKQLRELGKSTYGDTQLGELFAPAADDGDADKNEGAGEENAPAAEAETKKDAQVAPVTVKTREGTALPAAIKAAIDAKTKDAAAEGKGAPETAPSNNARRR